MTTIPPMAVQTALLVWHGRAALGLPADPEAHIIALLEAALPHLTLDLLGDWQGDLAATCSHTVIGSDGIEEPCDRPTTGARWYQNVDHEDLLSGACELHENEGGRRMLALIHEVERLRDVRVATLHEAERVVRLTKSAPQSSLTFDGGIRRAATRLRTLRLAAAETGGA